MVDSGGRRCAPDSEKAACVRVKWRAPIQLKANRVAGSGSSAPVLSTPARKRARCAPKKMERPVGLENQKEAIMADSAPAIPVSSQMAEIFPLSPPTSARRAAATKPSQTFLLDAAADRTALEYRPIRIMSRYTPVMRRTAVGVAALAPSHPTKQEAAKLSTK